MTSAKFLDFLPPAPCPHLELICSMKFMQPPLLHPHFHDPLPSPMSTSYLEAPSSRVSMEASLRRSVGLIDLSCHWPLIYLVTGH